MRTGHVSLDDLVTVPAIYDESARWNGWLIPYLTRQSVDIVMAALARDYPADMRAPSLVWRGNVARLVEWEGDDAYVDTLGTIVVSGVTYYALGAQAWAWDTAD